MFRSAVALIAATLLGHTAIADQAGYKPFATDAPHHGRGMIGAVFYPAGEGGRSFTLADSPVFHGVTVTEEASVADGAFPIVLISHGMGGNIRSLTWLSTALAARGAVVVSVNHPNSTWGDFDLGAGLRHWTRTQDLSLALDVVLSDPQLAGALDPSRVMVAGFSYGGWTALSMAGLRGSHAGMVSHCEAYKAVSNHCDVVLSEAHGLRTIAVDNWDASYRDDRVTHAVAIDPGLTWGLTPDHLSDLAAHVTLVGLGNGPDRMLATDFDKSGLAEMLPLADIFRIAPAMHFTALPLCKPMAEEILQEEQDDPVCSDPEGTDRAAVHQQIVDAIAGQLGL